MSTHPTFRAASLGALGLVFAARAETAILCVSPAGGACQTSIQDAVTAAAPGDTVNIRPGTYYENVVVGADKEGIRIVGSSRLSVIVDPSPYADGGKTGNTGPGFRIFARNVQLRTLTIRNGDSWGVLSTGAGLVAQGLVVNGSNLGGISTQGWYGLVLTSEVRNASIGIEAAGHATTVRGNLVVGTQIGISVTGSATQAVSNRVYTGQTGIGATGDGLVLKLNDVRDQSFQGIRVQGSYPIVQGNKVEGDSSDANVLVNCTDCFGGTASSNKVTGGAGYGLMAIADGPGLLVERNTVVRSRFGLSLNGEGIRATLNQATEIGQDFRDDCVEVFGDRHALVQNTARACARAGFYVGGSSNLLERNTVQGAFENGITVNGDDENGGFYTDNVLDGNKPSGSAGQGIAIINGAVGTLVRNNVSAKNRLDFCNDGTGTVLSGNTFASSADTGGVDCVIAH